MVVLTVLTVLASADAAFAAAPPVARSRVAVFPVVPVGEGVLGSAAGSMTEGLLEELGDRGVIAEDKPRTSDNAAKLIEDGRRNLHRMHVPQAIKALEGALALTLDKKQQARASLLLAEAYYRRGDEAKGKQAMETVARYASETTLAPDHYPPVFIKAYEDVKAVTPADLTSGASSGPGTTLRSILETNVFDNDVRQRALTSGRSAGADTVLILGMARGDRLFTLEAYAGQVRTGHWMALPVAQPDFDMLSASAEASRLVRELETFEKSELDNVFVHGLSNRPASVTVASAPVVTRTSRPSEEPGSLERDSVLAAIGGYDARPSELMSEPQV
ncbi:MAG: hypothetical protein H7Z43_07710, partial [Clostridia bacterium]|nr:hypothetical protein [Deltaproteobacteria bacterium]